MQKCGKLQFTLQPHRVLAPKASQPPQTPTFTVKIKNINSLVGKSRAKITEQAAFFHGCPPTSLTLYLFACVGYSFFSFSEYPGNCRSAALISSVVDNQCLHNAEWRITLRFTVGLSTKNLSNEIISCYCLPIHCLSD